MLKRMLSLPATDWTYIPSFLISISRLVIFFLLSLEPDVVSKSVAPLKFCIPHVAVSFGPAGQLVRVSPALPSHGEPAQVEMHSLEVPKTHGSSDTEYHILFW